MSLCGKCCSHFCAFLALLFAELTEFTERVRKDEIGDSEDVECDELPCAIGESEGDFI